MKFIRTAIVLLATVLSATGAYSQTPNGAPERDFPRVQTPPKPSETTGAGTRPQNELGPTNIVPAMGRLTARRHRPSKVSNGLSPRAVVFRLATASEGE
jgi:hypothetical protein